MWEEKRIEEKGTEGGRTRRGWDGGRIGVKEVVHRDEAAAGERVQSGLSSDHLLFHCYPPLFIFTSTSLFHSLSPPPCPYPPPPPPSTLPRSCFACLSGPMGSEHLHYEGTPAALQHNSRCTALSSSTTLRCVAATVLHCTSFHCNIHAFVANFFHLLLFQMLLLRTAS